MDQLIIGIHGLGNKPSKKLLERWWKKSIIEGLNRINSPVKSINFELVYWADIIYSQPLKLSVKDKNDPFFLDEPYSFQPVSSYQIVAPNPFLARVFKFFERQLDRVFLNKDMSLKFAPLTETVIKRYFHDLEIYYNEPGTMHAGTQSTRQLIQSRLIDIINRNRNRDILLIAHSMGSIIAYDVLHSLENSVDINTMITVGSPLGLPMIVSRIFNELKAEDKKLKKLKTPENVKYHWYNISDKDDKVALDHTLADDYGQNKNNVQPFDISVYNDYNINRERNPHKIYGYLRSAGMAQIISHFYSGKKSPEAQNYQSLKTWIISQANRIKNRFKTKVLR